MPPGLTRHRNVAVDSTRHHSVAVGSTHHHNVAVGSTRHRSKARTPPQACNHTRCSAASYSAALSSAITVLHRPLPRSSRAFYNTMAFDGDNVSSTSIHGPSFVGFPSVELPSYVLSSCVLRNIVLCPTILQFCVMLSYVLSYYCIPILRPIVLKYYALQSYVLPFCHPAIRCDVLILKTIHCVKIL